MNISSGKVVTAQKVVVYGPEGIGKSTFASKFPKPVFIDTEGSTKKLDVSRFDRPTSWTMLIEQVKYMKNCKDFNTLVIDTADWAEKLCINHICSTYQKTGIEDFGYGKGYVYLAEEFGKLLNLLEDIVNIGINVVITAHAIMRKFEQPDEMGSYDRWELKLEKKTAPLVKEWADMLLFANYKTNVISVSKDKYKAQGQKRMMYTTHNACYDAKNRDGLDDELPFEYGQIAHLIDSDVSVSVKPNTQKQVEPTSFAEPQMQKALDGLEQLVETAPPKSTEKAQSKTVLPDYIPKALADLMQANDVSEKDIQLVVAQRGYYPADASIADYDSDFIAGCLIGAWEKMYKLIVANNDLPFED